MDGQREAEARRELNAALERAKAEAEGLRQQLALERETLSDARRQLAEARAATAHAESRAAAHRSQGLGPAGVLSPPDTPTAATPGGDMPAAGGGSDGWGPTAGSDGHDRVRAGPNGCPDDDAGAGDCYLGTDEAGGGRRAGGGKCEAGAAGRAAESQSAGRTAVVQPADEVRELERGLRAAEARALASERVSLAWLSPVGGWARGLCVWARVTYGWACILHSCGRA